MVDSLFIKRLQFIVKAFYSINFLFQSVYKLKTLPAQTKCLAGRVLKASLESAYAAFSFSLARGISSNIYSLSMASSTFTSLCCSTL